MKILVIFTYAPLPPPLDLGGMKRNIPFFLEHVKRHEVSVLAFGDAAEETMFRDAYGAQCKRVKFVDKKRPRIVNALERLWLLVTWRCHFRQIIRPVMQEAMDEMCATGHFDVIHCTAQMMGYYSFPAGVPVVSDTHEVTYDLIYRTYRNTRNPFWKLFHYLTYRISKPEEIMLCRKFDAVIATTTRDEELFRKDLPDQRIVVIQNGVQRQFFELPGTGAAPHSMVFTGLMTHFPNNHGLLWFLDEIFPKILAKAPDAKITIVGKSPSKQLRARASDNIIVTGFVNDVRRYMAGAEVYIIPLLVGGGIRGKALEAMAMRIPIVTTTIGVEGIHLDHEQSAMFGDSPEAFAACVLRLFAERELRRRIVENAFATVKEEYDWEAKGRDLQRVYEEVIDARKRRNGNETGEQKVNYTSIENAQ